MENEKDKLPSIEEIAAELKKENETTEPGSKKADAGIEQLIELLSSHNHEHKDAGLELLKNEKSVDFLINAITQTPEKTHKAVLTAACWESGLDFKGHEVFFTNLALDTDMFVSLEAITVLDNMEMEVAAMQNIIQKIDEKALLKHANKEMLMDFKNALIEKINNPGGSENFNK
jgi:hypothetical protein